jgi:hypothetical protein
MTEETVIQLDSVETPTELYRKITDMSKEEKDALIAKIEGGFESKFYAVKYYKNGGKRLVKSTPGGSNTAPTEVASRGSMVENPQVAQTKQGKPYHLTDQQYLWEQYAEMRAEQAVMKGKLKRYKKKFKEYVVEDEEIAEEAVPEPEPEPEPRETESILLPDPEPVPQPRKKPVRGWRDLVNRT